MSKSSATRHGTKLQIVIGSATLLAAVVVGAQLMAHGSDYTQLDAFKQFAQAVRPMGIIVLAGSVCCGLLQAMKKTDRTAPVNKNRRRNFEEPRR